MFDQEREGSSAEARRDRPGGRGRAQGSHARMSEQWSLAVLC